MDKRTAEHLADRLGHRYLQHQRLHGGDIGIHYLLITDQARLFVKSYPGPLAGQMLQCEAYALQLIQNTNSIATPQMIQQLKVDHNTYLIMEFIESGIAKDGFWEDFAIGLAKLHEHPYDLAGFEMDNFIGSLPQSNLQRTSWKTFYINSRLLPQFKQAFDSNKFGLKDQRAFEQYLKEIEPTLQNKHVLLHGDLWNGNYLINPQGKAVLIDPASYIGHPLMDIAMSLLFGGFDQSFYELYAELSALDANWQQQISLYQLYPLLVHTNLFGGHYADSCRAIWR